MKRAAIVVGGLIAVLIAATWIAMQFASVDLWLYRRAAMDRVGAADVQLAKARELSVLLCGTNAPLPDPNRAGGCALIAAGDDLYVIDSGMGSVRNLMVCVCRCRRSKAFSLPISIRITSAILASCACRHGLRDGTRR
ncbi:MAG TPA: hypothetical protein VGH02_13365 [Rhizomicrobium sp.]|jgi:hypothetical protein